MLDFDVQLATWDLLRVQETMDAVRAASMPQELTHQVLDTWWVVWFEIWAATPVAEA